MRLFRDEIYSVIECTTCVVLLAALVWSSLPQKTVNAACDANCVSSDFCQQDDEDCTGVCNVSCVDNELAWKKDYSGAFTSDIGFEGPFLGDVTFNSVACFDFGYCTYGDPLPDWKCITSPNVFCEDGHVGSGCTPCTPLELTTDTILSCVYLGCNS